MADKDDDDLDTEITGDGETDQDDDADDGAEDTVESLRERLAKADAALKKANREAEKRRLAAKKVAAPAKKAASTESDDDRDDALAAVEARANERVIRTEGAVAILAAGFQGDRAAARDLAKLLDVSELELDDDGDVDGLDDAVEALKKRFPRLFESDDDEPAPRRRKPGSVNAARGSVSRTPRDGGAPKTSAEKLGMMLRGGR